MASTEQTAAMKTHTFDIKVALVGYVSVGKSTVLNALLGDKFSQVALKRTTAGVNFFRVVQPTESKGDEMPESKTNPEEEWSTIGDDVELQAADVVHEEISKDNQELRASELVEEKFFDIQVRYPICEMRKDTQLVLIDIPGINEAESSKKYKDYVESKWKTFDCVVVVMDAVQGVNTEEQVDLLKFVCRNNEELKDVPTIVLGNKMDDLSDEDTIHQINETRLKTIEIFGNVDCKFMPRNVEDSTEVESTNVTQGEIKTAFIPLSAKNAFTYMNVGSIELDQLSDPKYLEIVNKIGYDEFGRRKWSRMKLKEKVDAVMEILHNPSELDERLADTNFNSFLAALSEFVGGNTRQQEILTKQLEVEMNDLCGKSLGEKTISETIFEAFKRCQSIGYTNIEPLKKTFWKVYLDCENNAFMKCDTMAGNPLYIKRPFRELRKYSELTLLLQWPEESLKTINAMKQLLRRQFRFLFEKLESWSFESYCEQSGGTFDANKGGYTHHCGEPTCCEYSYCRKVCPSDNGSPNGYRMCGELHFFKWPKSGWETPTVCNWTNLSPHDWLVILDSLSLVWDQSCFLLDFGPEKVKLNAALMEFHSKFSSISGLDFDCVQSDVTNRICLHAYRVEIKRRKEGDNGSMTRVKMPSSLNDPMHWGFLSYRYFMFCNSQEDCGVKKRKASCLNDGNNLDGV